MTPDKAKKILQEFLEQIVAKSNAPKPPQLFEIVLQEDLTNALKVAISQIGDPTKATSVAATSVQVSENKTKNEVQPRHGKIWNKEEVSILKTWTEASGSKDVNALLRLCSLISGRSPFAVLFQMHSRGLITVDDADAFCTQLELSKRVSVEYAKSQAKKEKKNEIKHLTETTLGASHETSGESFTFYDKLLERQREIWNNVIQTFKKVPSVPTLHIIGDGRSMGQLTEHIDGLKNRQVVINRIKEILVIWINECAQSSKDDEHIRLARGLEIRLSSADQKSVYELLKLERQSDQQLVTYLKTFCAQGKY